MAEKVSLSLRWGSHQETVLQSLGNSFGAQDFVDLTLACEGQSIQAHRVIVSACSSFLKKLLQDHPSPHPIIILKDITMSELKQLLEFMYCGQVTVEEQHLESLLRAAQVLGVRGLTDVDGSDGSQSTASYVNSEEETNESNADDTVKSNKNVPLSGRRSILASYLSTPPSAKTLSLADLLSQPTLNTNSETHAQDPENSSITDSLSEIDVEVKQEEIDLGIESEYQDTQNVDLAEDLETNLDSCPKGIGKATAFMLTLAKRANRVATHPYSTNRPANRICYSASAVRKSSVFPRPNLRDEVALTVHSQKVQQNKTNSGQSKADEGTAEHKLAFYEARPCSVCGKMYRDAASLRTHVNIMHTTWRDGFECTCKQIFQTKYEMYQHRKNHGKGGRAWTPTV